MVRLKTWQWLILAMPIAVIVGFFLIAAGWQIYTWGINWIWAIFILMLVGWRWLLVKWTQPMVNQMENMMAQVSAELTDLTPELPADNDAIKEVESALQQIITATGDDAPIWEDWPTFWQRCQELVVAVAHIYHPEVEYPLLNIYIPQAYGLIRGTVDDLDRWMQNLSPILNQVTVGQAYQSYQTYRKLEPSARKLWQVWNWAQWLLNPAAAVAKTVSKESTSRAQQQLIANLGQMLRETALRNLAGQAIALYTEANITSTEFTTSTPSLPQRSTQTLREIISQARPVTKIEQKPVNILLVGRTGAGKSSLINTLFASEQAEVDILPTTEQIKSYHWQASEGETLTLWDTPGYEQVNRDDLRQLVLDYGNKADLLLLVTPALDPALQMDVDFLEDIKNEIEDLPTITIVTQVDRLRPFREWEPPYDWQSGNRPKERAIREATQYRLELLGEFCTTILPLVTEDLVTNRAAWGLEELSLGLVAAIAPAKELRIARFLRNQEARIVAAAKIIDRYTFTMTTTQGLAAWLKSPVLQFISNLSTGTPALAYVLAEQIPVEQLPVVIGKLQMAYDLYSLVASENTNFDLLSLWPLLLENSASPERNAWAFGHALVEYWTRNLTMEELRVKFENYQ